MPKQSNEANVILAIQAMKNDPKLSCRLAATIYGAPETTLRRRIRGQPPKRDVRNGRHILTASEEDTLVQYILDLDTRGFPPRIESVRDMANLLEQRVKLYQLVNSGHTTSYGADQS